ncbi:hypothetical protein PHMEG_00035078 [Phytophthora megakarya]|uniref:Uncharacterized protein n=1 Tax=Phytophthora megakarya TaxID=4795 RepID=A0A225UPV9_9STRA|nr:hypothetical protein PHMEG_00035078 [Phytophthora megakarya]
MSDFSVGVAPAAVQTSRGRGKHSRAAMRASQLDKVRKADKLRKALKRANRSESQVIRDREANAERQRSEIELSNSYIAYVKVRRIKLEREIKTPLLGLYRGRNRMPKTAIQSYKQTNSSMLIGEANRQKMNGTQRWK